MLLCRPTSKRKRSPRCWSAFRGHHPNGGEVVRAEQLGRRKLAYPINHRETGLYMLIHAQMERNAILELERHLRLSEDVLRHLLVRLDEIA